MRCVGGDRVITYILLVKELKYKIVTTKVTQENQLHACVLFKENRLPKGKIKSMTENQEVNEQD